MVKRVRHAQRAGGVVRLPRTDSALNRGASCSGVTRSGGRGRGGDRKSTRCAKLPFLHRAGWGRRGPGGRRARPLLRPNSRTASHARARSKTAPDERSAQRRAAGEGTGTAVGGGPYDITAGDAFTWKSDRAEVTLSLTSEGWIVQYSTVGRLLGPPQVLHQARHRDAKHATWDVMARVQSASHNEAEMVRAGHSAVQWIKSRPRWSELSLGGQGSGR